MTIDVQPPPAPPSDEPAPLTDAEAALYDRQLRVWGVEAQKRLSASKVVIVGSACLAAEVAKNLVLAGVGAVSLVDDCYFSTTAAAEGEGNDEGKRKMRAVTAAEAAAAGNFLAAAALAAANDGGGAEEGEGGGTSPISASSPAAVAAAAALREMNPHVDVSFLDLSSSSFDPSTPLALSAGKLAEGVFEGAAAVVYACGLGGGTGGSKEGRPSVPVFPFSTLHSALAADAAAASSSVPFFWGGVSGHQGFFFVNLHDHEFEVDEKKEEGAGEKEKKKGGSRKRKAGEEEGGGEAATTTATMEATNKNDVDVGKVKHQSAPKLLRKRNYASLERLLSHPWAGLHPRRTHGIVYALRTVFEWEAKGKATAAATAATTATATTTAILLPCASDLPLLLEAGHSLALSEGVAPHALPAFADDGALSSLARSCEGGRGRQSPSVAAVVGGCLANDVVRAVSRKGAPAVDNLFCFSLSDGKGVVERLGEVKEVEGGKGKEKAAGEEKAEEEEETIDVV